jgi:hypothetical protein
LRDGSKDTQLWPPHSTGSCSLSELLMVTSHDWKSSSVKLATLLEPFSLRWIKRVEAGSSSLGCEESPRTSNEDMKMSDEIQALSSDPEEKVNMKTDAISLRAQNTSISNDSSLISWEHGEGNEGVFVPPTTRSDQVLVVGRSVPSWGMVVAGLDSQQHTLLLVSLCLLWIYHSYRESGRVNSVRCPHNSKCVK